MQTFREWLREREELEINEGTVSYANKMLNDPEAKYASIKVLTRRQGQDYNYHTDFIEITKAKDALKKIKKYLDDSVGRITDVKVNFSDNPEKFQSKDYSFNILELK